MGYQKVAKEFLGTVIYVITASLGLAAITIQKETTVGCGYLHPKFGVFARI